MLVATLILIGAIGLIAVQPPLMRRFPRLQPLKRDPWVDFWAEAAVRNGQAPAVKPPKPGTLDHYNAILRDATQHTGKLLGQSSELLRRINSGELERELTTPPSEIYIDGTTGKRIVPAELSQFDRDQQLRDMERQITAHDQQMGRAWMALEQGLQNEGWVRMLGGLSHADLDRQ